MYDATEMEYSLTTPLGYGTMHYLIQHLRTKAHIFLTL